MWIQTINWNWNIWIWIWVWVRSKRIVKMCTGNSYKYINLFSKSSWEWRWNEGFFFLIFGRWSCFVWFVFAVEVAAVVLQDTTKKQTTKFSATHPLKSNNRQGTGFLLWCWFYLQILRILWRRPRIPGTTSVVCFISCFCFFQEIFMNWNELNYLWDFMSFFAGVGGSASA